jgi:hypothetical protein
MLADNKAVSFAVIHAFKSAVLAIEKWYETETGKFVLLSKPNSPLGGEIIPHGKMVDVSPPTPIGNLRRDMMCSQLRKAQQKDFSTIYNLLHKNKDRVIVLLGAIGSDINKEVFSFIFTIYFKYLKGCSDTLSLL